jgi:hypothetical protein
VPPNRISDNLELWAQVEDKDGHIIKGRWKKKVLISSLTVNANVSIQWKCHNGEWPNGDYADDHEWEQEIYARWDRKKKIPRRCPFCPGDGRRSICDSNSLGALGGKLVEEWHPDNELTPFQVLPYSHEKVKWKCHDGEWPNGDYADDHEWSAMVSDRSQGKGCPFCHGDSVCESNSLLVTHPELVKEWHPDNIQPASNFKAGTSLRYLPKWKCYKGTWPDGRFADDHEWRTRIVNRTRGSGCHFCLNDSKSRLKVCDSNSFAATEPDLAKLWSSKNTKKPNQVLPGSNRKYLWNCDNDAKHEYSQSIKSKTTQKSGCPSCKKKNETKVYEYCQELFPGLKIERNRKRLFKQNTKMELDIWFPDLKLGIEYQGEQHYFARKDWQNDEKRLIQRKKMDEQKRQYCAEKGIVLIEIKYDWKMDKNVLINALKGYL